MSKATDDLEAVRVLAETLKPFEAKDQERIIRWARERLGLQFSTQADTQEKPLEGQSPTLVQKKITRDIKTFIEEKNPTADTHFAATVAYYYKFEAPEAERKDSITASDLQEACRKKGRERLRNPGQTLINAHRDGLLDRVGAGGYAINTVGENLVAMTLPSGTLPKSTTVKRTSKKKTEKEKGTKRK